jgi:hypothetical protein
MSFETIHNFYEPLVFRYVADHLAQDQPDADYLADVACVALNHLPPRYIRHDVDMAFYLSPEERAEIDSKIAEAIRSAVAYIARHRKPAR